MNLANNIFIEQLGMRLQPFLAQIAKLQIEKQKTYSEIQACVRALETHFPATCQDVIQVSKEISRGISEGWLCNRGEPNSRFSRILKPCADSYYFSADLVRLMGEGKRHSHPLGEITLGFAADSSSFPTPLFDGHPPGWVILAPGTIHTPTVQGGWMHLLYFLPQGSVEWDF